ncbi:MAG: adenylate/guanylate cyclase domain-containing protein [Microcoleus sp. PH2017_22_RUC_O_B]|uniref:CHASE2 domain-containing protein n=1 Tax=Microcoleus sp. PH2017_22_RUC_O_B TaxID=2798833 RepID=UPI001D1D3B3A|nr:adenylate/guanylate cyclase domain-containing protein [Microcoleus sp. PH2017_22_RUC_O_B]MCC3544671.1 adenylate/guanylate cyclase domain-containing protein [Microcoleus sp. PH2017_22_RUC_O_B]
MTKSIIHRLRGFFARSQSLMPGVAAAIISLGALHLGGWKPLEQLGSNSLFQLRESGILPKPIWDKRVVVIAIDEASLRKLGRFPFSRDRYTQLLQALSPAKPAVVGFDIIFAEPSPQDDQLADAMSAIGNVVLAKAWDDRGKPLPIVPTLEAAAADRGHIFHKSDTDGIGRQATLWLRDIPSLGIAMLHVYNSDKQPQSGGLEKFLSPPNNGSLEFYSAGINWPGKTQFLPTYSFADVLEGKITKDAFKDKLVLVGTTATGLDPLRTPLNQISPTSGIYLHAAVIDNLLNNRLLQPLPDWTSWLILLLIGPITSAILSKTGPRGRIAIAILFPLIWYAVSFLLFTFNSLLMPIAAPIGTIVLAGIGLQLREQQEKQQLMSLFEKYMAKETAELIWQRKDEIFKNGEMQPQEMVATVLFMDIRGFTSISEQLSPGELMPWLNLYLNAMSECIMDRGGVIDKYIGDAIMAIFGIPFPHTKPEEIKQDAQNCIAACLDMSERLKQLNQQFEREGKPKIEFGVGIHTGSIIAGTVGGGKRLNFSVLGDTVNIAARLEAMNKDIKEDNPYRVLITGETWELVSDRYEARPVKSIQLRGRKQETTICAIVQPCRR